MGDAPAMDHLREANVKALAELDEKIDFAEKNFGSSEVKDAILEKANYYFKIGDHVRCVLLFLLNPHSGEGSIAVRVGPEQDRGC